MTNLTNLTNHVEEICANGRFHSEEENMFGSFSEARNPQWTERFIVKNIVRYIMRYMKRDIVRYIVRYIIMFCEKYWESYYEIYYEILWNILWDILWDILTIVRCIIIYKWDIFLMWIIYCGEWWWW